MAARRPIMVRRGGAASSFMFVNEFTTHHFHGMKIPRRSQRVINPFPMVALLVAAGGLLGEPALIFAGELKVGVAAVKITPAVGTPMAGYYSTRLAEGTHDDLWAKTLVFEQDGVKAAVVALDLVTVHRATVEAARQRIAQITGVRGDHVMMSATHSHTGPVLSGPSARLVLQGGDTDLARQYAAALPDKIAESVQRAEAKLAPARLSAGMGHEEHLSFNRRFFMKDGTVGWNPGKLNPNIVRSAGPIDSTVAVVFAESLPGQPLATYVNFPMHLDTVGGLQFSADYPYTLATMLGKIKGPEMVTLFTIGTAGDINHIDVQSGVKQGGPEEAARIGTVLAGEVLKTYARLKPLKTFAPRVRSAVVRLALPKLEPGDVDKAGAIVRRYGGQDEPKFLEKVWAFKVLDVNAREGRPWEVEVQVMALSDQLAWVSLPGEIFVELGLALKKASPFPVTILAELANGSVGYIPTRRAFAEGNYEVVSARCADDSGEKLVAAAIKLLDEVRP